MKYAAMVTAGGEKIGRNISQKEYEALEQTLPFGKVDGWFHIEDSSGDIFNYNRRWAVSVKLSKENENGD